VAVPTEIVEDGFLDPDSNYTAFVEVIVPSDGSGPDASVVGRSPYMSPRKPGQTVSFLGGESGHSGVARNRFHESRFRPKNFSDKLLAGSFERISVQKQQI
jgi:hypothetical protein